MPESLQHPTVTARTPVAVRSESLDLILDAFEQEETLSRTRLAKLTGLGTMTVQRAVRRLCLEGILMEQRAPDPRTGRQCGLLSPAPLVPILVMDLSIRPMTAYLLQSPLFLPEHCRVRDIPTVTFYPWDEFSTEDNLRLFLARIRQQLLPDAPEDSGRDNDDEKWIRSRVPLTRRQRVMIFRMAMQQACAPRLHGFHPVLLLPPDMPSGTPSDTSPDVLSGTAPDPHVSAIPDVCGGTVPDVHGSAAGLCPPSIPIRDTRERLIRVVLEELEHPDYPMCGGLTVTDARAACLYALSHSTQSTGRTSMLALLLGEHTDCFLTVRPHTGSDWFIPDCIHLNLDPYTAPQTVPDPPGDVPSSPETARLSALLTSCLHTVRPQALFLELTALPQDGTGTLCFEGLPPDTCRFLVNQTTLSLPLCVRGAAMMARRRLWSVRAAP